MTQDKKKQFEKQLIQYGLKNNYIEKEKDGTLKFVGSKNQKNKSVKHKNNLDIAMLITDDILNAFEIDGVCNIKNNQLDKLFCIIHRNIQNKKDSKVLTSEIYNHFKVKELCLIPLDESNDAKPYSWDLQDVIQDELEKIKGE